MIDAFAFGLSATNDAAQNKDALGYQLHLGDCLDVMATLATQGIDAIITDLPYGTTACSWDEVIPFAPMWEQVKRVLKPRGVFVTTASQPFTSKLVMSNLEWFKYEWIWNKISPTAFQIAKYQPMRVHENIVVFSRETNVYNPIIEKAKLENIRPIGRGTKQTPVLHPFKSGRAKADPDYDNMARYPKSIIVMSRFGAELNGASGNRSHPTQKPVALYAYLIRTYTNPGDTVLDFVMGSGATGVAAVKEGRRFVGIELDASYFAIAQRRIELAAAQPSLFEVMPC